MKHLKMLGLAAAVAAALMSVSSAVPQYFGGFFSPASAIGCLSFISLGATALRIGKSRHYSRGRLITNHRATAITTGTTTTTTPVPIASLSNSRYDREAPPNIPRMAC